MGSLFYKDKVYKIVLFTLCFMGERINKKLTGVVRKNRANNARKRHKITEKRDAGWL